MSRAQEARDVFDRGVIHSDAFFALIGLCAARDGGGRRCQKPAGHHRFRDGRRFHRSEEPHVGRMAETYRATWVRLWK